MTERVGKHPRPHQPRLALSLSFNLRAVRWPSATSGVAAGFCCASWSCRGRRGRVECCGGLWTGRARAGMVSVPGWAVQVLAEVPKPAAHARRRQLAGLGRGLPGQAQIGNEGAGESELREDGDDQPGPDIGLGGRPWPGRGLLEEPERVPDVEAAHPCRPIPSSSSSHRPAAEVHNHTGFGLPSCGSRSTVSRVSVPSRTGKVAPASIQAARCVSRGCSRSHEWASNLP